jgi:hypothetical protein
MAGWNSIGTRSLVIPNLLVRKILAIAMFEIEFDSACKGLFPKEGQRKIVF